MDRAIVKLSFKFLCVFRQIMIGKIIPQPYDPAGGDHNNILVWLAAGFKPGNITLYSLRNIIY